MVTSSQPSVSCPSPSAAAAISHGIKFQRSGHQVMLSQQAPLDFLVSSFGSCEPFFFQSAEKKWSSNATTTTIFPNKPCSRELRGGLAEQPPAWHRRLLRPHTPRPPPTPWSASSRARVQPPHQPPQCTVCSAQVQRATCPDSCPVEPHRNSSSTKTSATMQKQLHPPM